MTEKDFNRLYELKSGVVYLIAYNKLGNKEDAEDVTSLAFFNLWEAMESIESEYHAIQFLYKATNHRCIDKIRKDKVRPQIYYEDPPETEYDDTYIELEIIHSEVVNRIYGELEKLRPELRDAFVLSFIKKIHAGRISEMMHLSIHTVHTYVRRAMALLKTSLN